MRSSVAALFGSPQESVVYDDEVFTRFRLNLAQCDILRDEITAEHPKLGVVGLRIRPNQDLILSFAEVRYEGPDMIIVEDESSRQYGICKPLRSASYDEFGRIGNVEDKVVELTDTSLKIASTSRGLAINILACSNLEELAPSNWQEVERRKYLLYDLDIMSPLIFDRLLFFGDIYDPRSHDRVDGKMIRQEEVARFIYGYYSWLFSTTRKPQYGNICELIAHSILLRVPESGCLTHGSWTNSMETHFRYQADGLMLLSNHAILSKSPPMIDACRRLATGLRQAKCGLASGFWFLHDSLEAELVKAPTYPIERGSSALDHHQNCTVTLNTHIHTIVSLLNYRYKVNPSDEDVRQDTEAGLQALESVIRLRPHSAIYQLLFFLYDRIVWRAEYWQSRVRRKAAHGTSNLMLKAKARWPRVWMPNGAIERDLFASAFSKRYHIVNLYDLLTLYEKSKSPWIPEVVASGIQYVLQKGIHHRLILGYPGFRYWPAVLLLALRNARTAVEAKKYLGLLVDHNRELILRDLPWSIEALLSGFDVFAPSDFEILRSIPARVPVFLVSFLNRYFVLTIDDQDSLANDLPFAVNDQLSGQGFHVFEIA